MSVNKVKVLIVDDDPNLLKVMKEMLESKGCEVLTASHQREALSLLLTEIINIVFIDCVLLSEQGIDLVKNIRKYLGFSLDIVMMSGIVSQNSVYQYIGNNIKGFLPKPISNQYIDRYISEVRNNVMFGAENDFLLRVFNKKVLPSYKLKYLLSLEKRRSVDFLLVLNTFLDSQESGHITFSTHKKNNHKIDFNKGVIRNYSNPDSSDFLDYIVEKGFLLETEAEKWRGSTSKELINQMFKSCSMSPFQILDMKLSVLGKVLKQIMISPSISFKTKLFTVEKEEFDFQFFQKDLANFIFKNQGERFSESLNPLFGKQVLDLSLKFEADNDETDYYPEVRPLVAKLKTGLKLNSFSPKDNSFYKYLFYILTKGGVFFSSLSGQFKYMHLYERYKSLRTLFQGKDSYRIFQLLGNKDKSVLLNNNKLIHDIFLSFMNFNHSDKLPKDLPKDLLDLITEVIEQIRHHHNIIFDVKLKRKMEDDEKNRRMEKVIVNTKRKQSLKVFLERGYYDKAFSIIKEVPDELMDKDITWKLLYLWLEFAYSKEESYDEQKVKRYLQDLVKNTEIKQNHLYHYVLGLYYEKNNNYQKSLVCYENVKVLEPSFKIVYSSINRVMLENLKRKETTSVFKKIYDFSKTKKKKVS